MPFSTYRPDLMGTATVNVDRPLVCGEWATLNLTYTAGHFGIDDLGSLKISIRSASDETSPPIRRPQSPWIHNDHCVERGAAECVVSQEQQHPAMG